VCAVTPTGRPAGAGEVLQGITAEPWSRSVAGLSIHREGAAATLRIEGDASAAPFVLAGSRRRPRRRVSAMSSPEWFRVAARVRVRGEDRRAPGGLEHLAGLCCGRSYLT
jgi:hypothetical protein